jgi:DNA-binding FadR family transcriptional regulator
MPIQSIEPQRLYRQISEQLRTLILKKEFPVGSRLPAERDLAAQLGVSRPSLREALIALEVEGFIEVRMGSGIYVCAAARRRNDFDLSAEEGPLELIRARSMLEGEVAASAAKQGKKADFDAVAEALELMVEIAQNGSTPIEADRLFHVRIAEATHNSVLVGVVGRMFDLRLGPLFHRLHEHFETAEVWHQAIKEHQEILDALRQKDPDRARQAMQKHMQIAYRRLTSSLTAAKRRALPAVRPLRPVIKKPVTNYSAKEKP